MVIPKFSEKAQAIVDDYEAHIKAGFNPLPIPIVKADNAKLLDMDGNEYIDFLSFFAVANMGHSHPKIVEAACNAIKDCPLVNTAFINPSYAKLGVKINEILGYSRTICMCSGADATDTATKIARKWGYTKKGIKDGESFILTTSACYHGLTISTHSFASTRRDVFGPYVPNVGSTSPSGVFVEYGNIESLQKAIEADHERISAFMVEPIQGSAGIVDPPKGYLKQAFDLCKKYNILFIADEVQTGLGRAGALLKSFDEDINPDLVCLGKALAGGVAPLSAVIGNSEVMDIIDHGDIGSTMAANPPATAAAVAALEVLIDEDICAQSKEKGEILKKLLLDANCEEIIGVSGSGMLRAVILNPESINDKFNGARLASFCAANGVLVNSAGGGKRVRICPPPTISEEDLRKGVEIFINCVHTLKDVSGPILGVK
ncbi:hypothetical protein C6P40_001457 [Pichia californica]|uniref:Ornithine aminotransferase n=1 Tax=Pichia californica TaxID=460514 RepID=A0A9P6WJ08_9ASCO|nr:hypothetical protein C6P40_001457 [[Candida] californica]